MKIHPDGTLEGTAEELAAYQRQDTRVWNNHVQLGQAKPVSEPKAEIVPLLIDATVEQLIEELNKKSTLFQRHVNIAGDWRIEVHSENSEKSKNGDGVGVSYYNGEAIIFIYYKK